MTQGYVVHRSFLSQSESGSEALVMSMLPTCDHQVKLLHWAKLNAVIQALIILKDILDLSDLCQ